MSDKIPTPEDNELKMLEARKLELDTLVKQPAAKEVTERRKQNLREIDARITELKKITTR